MISVQGYFLSIDFKKSSWISMDIKKICGYPHNEYLHGYMYEYETDIYPSNKVHGSYYLYLIRQLTSLILIYIIIKLIKYLIFIHITKLSF